MVAIYERCTLMRPEHEIRIIRPVDDNYRFLSLKKKVKTISVEQMPNTGDYDTRKNVLHLEVLRSSPTTIVTREIPMHGIRSRTMKQRMAKEVVWSRATLRQEPFDDTYEYYRIFQEMAFKVTDAI
jgi:hypothetical protein